MKSRFVNFRIGLGLGLVALAFASGCNKQPGVTANAPPGQTGQAPAGVADRPSMSLPGAGGQTGGGDEDAPAQRAAPPAPTEGTPFDFGSSGRPRMGLGGGGGGGTTSSGGSASVKAPNGPGGKGMMNGFYPQFALTGVASNSGSGGTVPAASQGGFGGALYPVAQSGGSTPAVSNPGTGSANPGGRAAPRSTETSDSQASSTPDSFFEMAQTAFNRGDEERGINLLYAHFLADESARGKYPVQWYSALARPRLMLRWGVAVNYDAPRGENERPPVIGDDAAPRTPRSSAGDSDVVGASSSGPLTNAAASNSAYAKVDTSTPAGAYLYYTGDFGERLYRRLNDRRKHTEAYFGKIVKDLDERKPSTAGAPNAAAVIAPPPEVRDRPAINLGGGGGAPAGNSGRQAPAGGGNAGAGNARGGAAAGAALKDLANLWSKTETTDAPSGSVSGTLLPGVYFMGMGHRDQMVERGKELGLDLVIVIDVKLIKGGGGADFTTTVARLYDVNEPSKPIATTKSLKYADVAETRERISTDKNDPVEVELDKLFRDVVDKGYKSVELPAAVKEHVERRLDMILESESDDKLRAASEIVGYVSAGFLDSAKAQTALDRLLPGSGEMLLSGSAADRKKFLEDLVAKGGGRGSNDSNDGGEIR